jgi:PHD/YefM family antitoxin component YafN of YafNO toxin-antitoxin module
MAISVNYIRSLTEFRRRSKDFIEELHASKRPMVLTVNGEAAVIVQDAQAFQAIQDKVSQLEEELARLRFEALRFEVQRGIDQAEAGEVTTYTEDTASAAAASIKERGRARKSQA